MYANIVMKKYTQCYYYVHTFLFHLQHCQVDYPNENQDGKPSIIIKNLL